ncbi:MAG: VanZ family protein [Bacilli bacterium]|nr:VanZ family protein [Bacilli bacterium]MDD4733918.1 VanZ family protein [Bacilli bacterium]
MFRNIVINILELVWPSLLICSIIFISLRLTWLIKNKKVVNFHNELMMFLFGIYVLCIFYVVTFQDVDWSTSNFIPFKEIFRYDFGTRLFYKNVIGNMMMFMPYGLFITYFLKTKKVSLILFLSFILSLTIEITQFFIGRVFDIDDIMLNLIGALIGFYLFRIINYIKQKLPKVLKNSIFYSIVLIIIMIVFVLYLSKIINIGV